MPPPVGDLLRANYQHLVGLCAFVCRRYSPFTTAWMAQTHAVLDAKLDALRAQGVLLVVAEQNRERVQALRAQGIPAVCGDAADAEVLIQAHVARARCLVVATPDSLKTEAMLRVARQLQPGIQLVLRSHNEEEAQWLRQTPGATESNDSSANDGYSHDSSKFGARRTISRFLYP